MNTRVLVHIGYHKTASTWLQKEVFSPSSEFFYPLSKSDSPRFLAKYFIYDEDGYLLSPFRSRKDSLLEQLGHISSTYESDARIGVISDERLSGNPHSGGFDARSVADRIHECLPHSIILCVIRRQQDMILSMYMQYLKIGGTDNLRDYLCRPYDGKRPGFSPGYLEYIDLVNYYTELFGRDQVLVLPYELFCIAPDDFLHRVGMAFSKDAKISMLGADRLHNKHTSDFTRLKFPGLNRFALSSSVNDYSALRIPGLDRMLRLTSRGFGSFSNSVTETYRNKAMGFIVSFVGDRYTAGNRLLSSRIDIDLSQYGYHD